MEYVADLFDQFSHLLSRSSLTTTEACITCEYCVLSYDLIDCDLEYDEMYHDEMMKHFDRLVIDFLKQAIKDKVDLEVVISKFQQQNRGRDELCYKTTLNTWNEDRGRLLRTSVVSFENIA